MQLNGIYSSLSDKALDEAYATQYAKVNAASRFTSTSERSKLSAYHSEIMDRLGGVIGFASGVFGFSSFPKFDDIQRKTGGFVQTEVAQSAVKQSAGQLASDVKSAVTFGVGGVVVGGAALLLLYAYLRGRK